MEALPPFHGKAINLPTVRSDNWKGLFQRALTVWKGGIYSMEGAEYVPPVKTVSWKLPLPDWLDCWKGGERSVERADILPPVNAQEFST